MSSVWLITFDGKNQYIAKDHVTATRLVEELEAIGERRETMDLSITPLPFFCLDSHSPYSRKFHRATKAMFPDVARKITPNVHSWERILPSLYTTQQEQNCVDNGGIWWEVVPSSRSTTITVIGFDRTHVLEVFNDQIDEVHEAWKTDQKKTA